jgi:hypothetical protein
MYDRGEIVAEGPPSGRGEDRRWRDADGGYWTCGATRRHAPEYAPECAPESLPERPL